MTTFRNALAFVVKIVGIGIFAYAVYVQNNDPDWYWWMPIYGYVVFLCSYSLRKGKTIAVFYYLLPFIGYVVYAALLYFVLEGTPSPHRDQMLAPEKNLECLGLLIAALWIAVLWFFESKINHKARRAQR